VLRWNLTSFMADPERAGVLMVEAVKSHYERAIAAGHGTHNWTALYEVINARR